MKFTRDPDEENKNMEKIIVKPDGPGLMRGLRRVGGYSFPQAMADLVDNSIDAGATTVSIDVRFDGARSWVRISDNGSGMPRSRAVEAMTPGSSREYEEEDMGKYGLGMKMASLSQGRLISMATRHASSPNRPTILVWDLDVVNSDGELTLLRFAPRESSSLLAEALPAGTGTVVLIEKLDRLLPRHDPSSAHSRCHLLEECRALENHLSMVFHRFLAPSRSRRQVSILVNGNKLSPWDPFCRAEPATVDMGPKVVHVSDGPIVGRLEIHPFVLPRRDCFSSPEAFSRASGASGWNQMQGFYVERSHRLIVAGGWHGLRARDEHTKLARVSLSFMPELDDLVAVNASKIQLDFPRALREEVDAHVQECLRLARETYRRKPPKSRPRIGGSSTASSGRTATRRAPAAAASAASPTPVLTREQWAKEMTRAATAGERPVIESVLARLGLGRRAK